MKARSNGDLEEFASAPASSKRLPIRISKVAGRYLVFSIDDLMHARRHHRLCPVFSGTTPQNPQQNAFTGLPAELMPEEAAILVRGGFGYVVDDAAVHYSRLSGLTASSDSRANDEHFDNYLQNVRDIGTRMHEAFEEERRLKQVEGLQKMQKNKKQKNKKGKKMTQSDAHDENDSQETQPKDESHEAIVDLFQPPPQPQTPQTKEPKQIVPHPVTPTSSGSLVASPFSPPPIPAFLLPPSPSSPPSATTHTAPVDNLPLSYPLYAHLHDMGYFMMPGLRFGCDYNVYPGDPLRFHSHFQATALHYDDPDEEFSLLDLGAGGRLGTGVKKSFLIGGAVTTDDSGKDEKAEGKESQNEPEAASLETPPVRAFSIEWAGM